jgi:hypothetical protein
MSINKSSTIDSPRPDLWALLGLPIDELRPALNALSLDDVQRAFGIETERARYEQRPPRRDLFALLEQFEEKKLRQARVSFHLSAGELQRREAIALGLIPNTPRGSR